MISVASFSGHIYADQFSRSRASRSWKESRHAADGLLLHCRRHCKVFCLKAAVHTTHDALPEPETEIRIVAAFFVVIIASPYRTGIVGGISAEPEVLVIGGSTRFASDRHIADLTCCTSTAVYYILHSAGQNGSCAFLENSAAFAGTVQQYISVVIQNLGIQHRLVVNTAVCDSSIGGAEFIVVDTIRQTAKSKCLSQVGEYGAVPFLSVYQSADAEVFTVIISQLLADLIAQLNGADVDRPCDSIPDCTVTAVSVVRVP